MGDPHGVLLHIDGLDGQPRDFAHSSPTAHHQRKYRPVSGRLDHGEQAPDRLVPHRPGQPVRHPHPMLPKLHRILRDFPLIPEIPIQMMHPTQDAIDRRSGESCLLTLLDEPLCLLPLYLVDILETSRSQETVDLVEAIPDGDWGIALEREMLGEPCHRVSARRIQVSKAFGARDSSLGHLPPPVCVIKLGTNRCFVSIRDERRPRDRLLGLAITETKTNATIYQGFTLSAAWILSANSDNLSMLTRSEFFPPEFPASASALMSSSAASTANCLFLAASTF